MAPVFQSTKLPSPFKIEVEGEGRCDYEDAYSQDTYVLPARRHEFIDRTPAVSRDERRAAIFVTSGPVAEEHQHWGDLTLFRTESDLPSLIEYKSRGSAADISEALQQLREWTGLHAGEVADVLNVSRRALYYWIRSGRPSPEKRHDVLRLADSLIPLGKRWSPERIRIWLTSGEPSPLDLLREKQDEQFEHLRKLFEEETLIPTRIISDSELVDTDDDASKAFMTSAYAKEILQKFSHPRQARTKTVWEPPELTDSTPTDE